MRTFGLFLSPDGDSAREKEGNGYRRMRLNPRESSEGLTIGSSGEIFRWSLPSVPFDERRLSRPSGYKCAGPSFMVTDLTPVAGLWEQVFTRAELIHGACILLALPASMRTFASQVRFLNRGKNTVREERKRKKGDPDPEGSRLDGLLPRIRNRIIRSD